MRADDLDDIGAVRTSSSLSSPNRAISSPHTSRRRSGLLVMIPSTPAACSRRIVGRVIDGPYVDRQRARCAAVQSPASAISKRGAIANASHRRRRLEQRGRSFLAEQRQAQAGLLCRHDFQLRPSRSSTLSHFPTARASAKNRADAASRPRALSSISIAHLPSPVRASATATSASVGIRSPRNPAPKRTPASRPPDRRRAHRGDPAAPVGGAVHGRIMNHHDFAVARHPHVELAHIGAETGRRENARKVFSG